MCRPAIFMGDNGIGHQFSDGTYQRVKWAWLTEASIVAVPQERSLSEIYVHLVSEDGTGLLIPYGPYGEELFKRMACLPGFDMEITLRALLSNANARIVCWRRNEHVRPATNSCGHPPT